MQKYVVYFVIAAALAAGGYWKGAADTREENLVKGIAALNSSITELNKETKQAGKLNLQLHNTISVRQKADAKSTQEFTNALAATAHLRVNCVFDNNIMRQLSEAADRADQAASSGLTGAMSTGDPPLRQ